MATLKVGTCADPENRIDKSATFTYELTGNFRENVSVLDPVVVVESTSNLSGCNYAYITEFGRYYYIRDIIILGAKLYELHLHVDVLKTYETQIIAAPSIISKSANTFNLYLNDTNYKCYQNNHVLINTFPDGIPINKSKFVLTIFGAKECQTP